ncbi:MAG: ABC transporter permease [Candidatus Acidiferrales bacterium]
MPDWAQYVRQNLRLAHLQPEREAEIVEDLAGQLDEAYREALERGLTQEQAEAAAMQHVADWSSLANELVHSKRGKESAMTILQHRAEDRDAATRGRFSLLTELRQDIFYGLRMLRKSPGFTAVAVLTLALGIGASTAIFSIVNGVLLQPLAFHQPEQLCVIREIIPQLTKFYPTFPANLPTFRTWQRDLHSFENMGLAEGISMDFTGRAAVELPGAEVTSTLLDTLGVHPALGRNLMPDEDKPGRDNEVILMDSFWRSEFRSDPSIIGKAMTLNGKSFQIVGVLPPSFHFPQNSELGSLTDFSPHLAFLKPLGEDPSQVNAFDELNYAAIARLKPGVSLSQALAELDVVQAQIAKQANEHMDLRGEIVPLASQMLGPARQGLLFLLAAVSAVLLIVCVNLANLLLARVPRRMREAAIRTALGATRARLARQMLTESLLLAFLGGVLGILLAYFGLSSIVSAAPPGIPRLAEISIDSRVLLFAIVLSVLTAALFGMLPAWRIAQADPQDALKSGALSTTENRRTRRLRSSLIGLEVALSTVLLILGGLFTSSLVHLLRINTGFSLDHILAADVSLPPQVYGALGSASSAREHFYKQTLASIRTLPGVRSVGWINYLPLEGEGDVSDVRYPGTSDKDVANMPLADYRAASSDYFRTMGIPLIAGRIYTEADRGRKIIVISQRLAERLWPGKNPVGQICHLSWADVQGTVEIIGVVGDIRTIAMDKSPVMMVYCPPWLGTAATPVSASIVIRTTMDPRATASAIRNAIRSADPSVPITAVRPMTAVVSKSVDTRRFQMLLATLFAICALFLASIGIFGVVAYSVEQRRHELGIRMALGAQLANLRAMILRQGMAPVLTGLAAGIGGSLVLGRLIADLLFGVRSFDPLTFACVTLVVVIVALLACYIPARRAMRVDPMVALRYE